MKERDRFRDLTMGISNNVRRQRQSMRHPLITSILILALVVQSGCATSESDKVTAPTLLLPLSRGAVQELGRVGVTSGRFPPKLFVTSDVKTEIESDPLDEFAKAEIAAANKQVLGEMIGALPLLPFIVVALPVIGLMAWIEKPTEAQMQEHIQQLNKRLAVAREVVKTRRLQDELRDRFIDVSPSLMLSPLVALASWGPSSEGERPDYRPLSQEGVQTVLEVVIENVWISTWKERRWLEIAVTSRLVRTADNIEIHMRRNVYLPRGPKLAEWGDSQEHFQTELNRAFGEIAANIMKDIGFY